jgi:glycine/D-amino acid oxidase-like deaminating enzyme
MAAVATPIWGDPHDWDNPPPLEGEARADVCVVGLGGSGLAAVGALLDAGATVAGVDAGPVAAGAAGRNGGFLLAGGSRFHHAAVDAWGRERAVELYRLTLEELDRLDAELGPAIVRRVGSERRPASPDEAEDCRLHAEALRRDGLPVAPLEEGSILLPTDGAVDPLARCRALATNARRRGARLYASSPATEVRGDRVATPHGEVACTAVIVAVDGGLARVLPELAGRVRSLRLQMLGTAPVDRTVTERPVYYRWGYDYWQQLPDGRIALGGARDGHEGTEWGAAPEPTDPVQHDIDRLLRDTLAVDAPVTHRWAGEVAFTGDGLSIAEEVRPGVIAVGAHNGHGNVLGSALGRAAAAIALGSAPPRLWELIDSQPVLEGQSSAETRPGT